MLRKRKEQEKERLKNLKDFLKDEEGMGTVEIILIIVENWTTFFQMCFMSMV